MMKNEKETTFKSTDWQRELLAIVQIFMPIALKKVVYNKNKLDREMRVWMPYVVRQQDNHGQVFSLENRYYRPLGIDRKAGWENWPRKTFDKATADEINRLLDSGAFYKGDTDPCFGFKQFKAYVNKLISILDRFKSLDGLHKEAKTEQEAARPPAKRPKEYKSPRERGVS
jgi:hypothetical protein